ncbi:MAG: hypothetical protein KIS92_13795 [Planctomycetota bacterium]|nr:hypothetical protein [Planctomycetota bacterium]
MHIVNSRMLPATLVLLLAGVAGALAEDAPAKPEASVPDLIQKLKSDDEDERAVARTALSLKGDAIRAELQKALDGAEDPDFKAQIKQVMKNLGQNEMLRPFDQPVTIDLDLKDAPVSEALAKLKEAFGVAVQAAEGAAAKKVTVSQKGLTFFEALDAVRLAAKLAYRVDQAAGMNNKDKSTLCVSLDEPGEKGWCAAAPAGPFLLVVQSVSASGQRTLNPNGAMQENRQLNMQMGAVAQPGLTLGDVTVNDTKFTDAKGTETNGYNHMRGRGFGFRNNQGGGYIYLNDGMQLGGEASGPLTWTADLKVLIPLKMVSKTLDDLSEGGSLEVSDGKVTVQKPAKSGNSWKLRIVFPANSEMVQGGNAGMRAAFVVAGNQGGNKPPKESPGYFVLNAAGDMIQSQGMSGSGDGRTMTYDLNFNEEPKSILFQWHGEKTERSFKAKLGEIPIP